MAENLYGRPVVHFENAQAPSRPEPYEPLVYFLDRMPSPGQCWPKKKREAWLRTIEAIFDLVYCETPEEVKPEVIEAWWRAMPPAQITLSDDQARFLISELERLKPLTDNELWLKFKAKFPYFAAEPGEVRTQESPVPSTTVKKSTKTKTKRVKT